MKTVIKAAAYLAGLAVAAYAGWHFGTQYEPQQDQDQDEVLATINGVAYGKDWFIEQMKLRGGNRPGQYQETQQKQALLEFLINQEVIYMQAKEQGLDREPAIDRLYKKAVVDKYLQDNLNQKVANAKVTEAEVKAHFEANPMVYNKPARRRGAMIFLGKNEQADDAVRAEQMSTLESIIEQVDGLPENTTHFGELARQYSEDKSSKYQGGVVGWLIQHPSRKYKWEDAMIEALFALENVGDVSPVIEADKGFYLVRLVAAENVKEKSFDQVKSGIKNQLLQAKRKQIRNDFMLAMQQQAEVTINQQMLASIPAFSTPEKQPLKPPALPGGNGGL